MNSGIPIPAEALARTLMISSSELFIFLEGIDSDPPFYEKIFENHRITSTKQFTIFSVKRILIDGEQGGGREQLYKLASLLDSRRELKQRNGSGWKHMLFMADRDFTHLVPKRVIPPHVIHTRNADVEAEILLNGSLLHTVKTAFSLRAVDASMVVPNDSNLHIDLAEVYREWITLLLISRNYDVNVHGVTHAGPSLVNGECVGGTRHRFGVIDFDQVKYLRDDLELRLVSSGELGASENIDRLVALIYLSGDQTTLLKGEWIAQYICHRVYCDPGGLTARTRVNIDLVIAVCLATLDFHGVWARHFFDQIDGIISANEERSRRIISRMLAQLPFVSHIGRKSVL